MIARSSVGSVPSTASMSVFLQKGLLDLFQVAIERDDARLARLLRVADHLFQHQRGGSSPVSKNTAPRLPKASSTIGRGNWSITAPSVPPKTISAAVGCRICADFAALERQPEQDPAEGHEDAAEAALVHGLRSPVKISRSSARDNSRAASAPDSSRLQGSVEHDSGTCAPVKALVKLTDPLQHLFDRFAHNQLFSRQQSDYGVGSRFNELDQVGVDDQWLIVQSSQVVSFPSELCPPLQLQTMHESVVSLIGDRDSGISECSNSIQQLSKGTPARSSPSCLRHPMCPADRSGSADSRRKRLRRGCRTESGQCSCQPWPYR